MSAYHGNIKRLHPCRDAETSELWRPRRGMTRKWNTFAAASQHVTSFWFCLLEHLLTEPKSWYRRTKTSKILWNFFQKSIYFKLKKRFINLNEILSLRLNKQNYIPKMSILDGHPECCCPPNWLLPLPSGIELEAKKRSSQVVQGVSPWKKLKWSSWFCK